MDLRSFRKRLGFRTATAFAGELGLSVPTISRIERGLSGCNVETLEKLRRWIAEAGLRAGIPAAEWPDRDGFAPQAVTEDSAPHGPHDASAA
jgi:transcriptional regulator with XRE-family HTH domain